MNSTAIISFLLVLVAALFGIIGIFIGIVSTGKNKLIERLQIAVVELNTNNLENTKLHAETVQELKDLIHELREWATNSFIKTEDYKPEHRALEKRLTERLELHEKVCPASIKFRGMTALPGNGD